MTAKSPRPKPASPTTGIAVETREQLRRRLARRYAYGVAFFAAVLGYAAYGLTPGEALGVPAEVRRHAATAFGTLVVAATGLLGLLAFRRRSAELERARNLQAQLTLYRVGETLDRFDREDDPVRCALDVIAQGTGLAHWAFYQRDERDRAFRLTATRGLPPGATAELEPEPIGPAARTPAARAAWLLETIVLRERGSAPAYAFPADTEGLGEDPIVVSVPLVDRETAVGVLQCFVPRRRGFQPDQLALVRWMASQLAVGLKRLRMERRDRVFASYLRGSAEVVLVLDEQGRVTDANDAAERALRADPGTLVGRPLSDFAAEEEGGRPFVRGEPLRDGDAERLALVMRRGDGTTFPCEATLVTVAHPGAGGPARLLVGRGIAERRERQAAVRRSAGARIAGAADPRSGADRDDGNDAGRVLARASHDLRTPLHSVVGFATLLEQGCAESEEEARGFARSIRESAERLLEVLGRVVDCTAAEAGRATPSPGRDGAHDSADGVAAATAATVEDA